MVSAEPAQRHRSNAEDNRSHHHPHQLLSARHGQI